MLGPIVFGIGGGEPAEQPAGLVGGRIAGEVAKLLLECGGVRRPECAGKSQGDGPAAGQGTEHACLGANGRRAWVCRRPGEQVLASVSLPA